jgi:hypothetical protein
VQEYEVTQAIYEIIVRAIGDLYQLVSSKDKSEVYNGFLYTDLYGLSGGGAFCQYAIIIIVPTTKIKWKVAPNRVFYVVRNVGGCKHSRCHYISSDLNISFIYMSNHNQ